MNRSWPDPGGCKERDDNVPFRAFQMIGSISPTTVEVNSTVSLTVS